MKTGRLCVFLGSGRGVLPDYAKAARDFGAMLANRGIGLVYGGGSLGLMGQVAEGASAAGGEVIGVIPEALREHEGEPHDLSDLHVVSTMHERKALMAELSDGFVALPGGIGTCEELFEVWTWSQLGYHAKPCALFNVNGFFDGMRQFIDHMVTQGFLRPEHREILMVHDDPARLLDAMHDYRPIPVTRYIDRVDL